MKHLLRCILIALIVLASTSIFFTGCGDAQPVSTPPSVSSPADVPTPPITESPGQVDYFMSHWISGESIYNRRQEIAEKALAGAKPTGERLFNVFDVYETEQGNKVILSGFNLVTLDKDGSVNEEDWARLRMPFTGDAIYKYDSEAEYNVLMNNYLNFQSRIAQTQSGQPQGATDRLAQRETLSGRLGALNPREFYYVNNLPTEMVIGEGYINLIELEKYAPFTFSIEEQTISSITLRVYNEDSFRNYVFITDTQGDSSKVHTIEISKGPDKADMQFVKTDGYNIRFMQDMYLNLDIPTIQTIIGFDVEVYEDLGIANIVTDEFDICQDYRMKQMVQAKKINTVPVTTKPIPEEVKQIVEEQKQKGGNATYKDLAEYFEAQNGKPKEQTPPSGKDAPVFGTPKDNSTASKELGNGKYTSPEATKEIGKELDKLRGKA